MELNSASSIQDVNEILQVAQQATMEQAEKLLKAAVTAAVQRASLPGVGENIDASA